jgi:hypothetical protein
VTSKGGMKRLVDFFAKECQKRLSATAERLSRYQEEQKRDKDEYERGKEDADELGTEVEEPRSFSSPSTSSSLTPTLRSLRSSVSSKRSRSAPLTDPAEISAGGGKKKCKKRRKRKIHLSVGSSYARPEFFSSILPSSSSNLISTPRSVKDSISSKKLPSPVEPAVTCSKAKTKISASEGENKKHRTRKSGTSMSGLQSRVPPCQPLGQF